MGETLYQIVVTGELLEGTYLPDVKARLAALFKTPAEKLDPLFSGKRVVIKKGLGADAAHNYVAAVETAGLRCFAEPQETSPPSPSPGSQVATPAGATGTSAVTVAPVGTVLSEAPKAATPQIDISAYSMAAAGETLIEPEAVPVPEIDISGLSAAPAGADLVEHTPPPVPDIDISALSVAPPGSQMAEAVKIETPAIDIGDLDVAPVGSDMGEAKRSDSYPPPDTSHLKLD